MRQKADPEQNFIRKVKDKLGSNIDFSTLNYNGPHSTVTLRCKIHNEEFSHRACDILHYGLGCPKCTRKTYVDFLKLTKKFGLKENSYELVTTKLSINIVIKCLIHGGRQLDIVEFNHKKGCPDCVVDKKKEDGFNQFLIEGRRIYGFKFDYSKAKLTFKNVRSNVEIVCPNHGSFITRVYDHLYRNFYCKQCKADKRK